MQTDELNDELNFDDDNLPRVEPPNQLTAREEPRYGYYPWWPEDGNEWLHPEDVELARSLIPSNRVFRREQKPGEFDLLVYGNVTLRVRHVLWKEVKSEGYEIGDWVEVLSRGMTNAPCTAVIREMHWDAKQRCLKYQVEQNEKRVPNWYLVVDLTHVEPTLEEGPEMRIEATEDADLPELE